MERWHDFFVAEAGAAAALAGLVFVAVSINLARILEFPHLPMRAAETLAALLSVLVISTFGLIPDQSVSSLGCEIAASGLFFLAIQTTTLVRSHKSISKHVNWRQHALFNLAPPLPFVIAGALMVMGYSAGPYWIVAGVLLSFLTGIVGAWVLLIEILR
ncbi:MAG: hypothetical protein ABUS48_07060 [Pseudomonadota bacterium]